MSKVFLIPCCGPKLKHASQARELYQSTIFKYTLEIVLDDAKDDDRVFILSALYGLVELDEVINPYDYTLANSNTEYKKEWSNTVLDQLEYLGLSLEKDEFIVYAGKHYNKYLLPKLKNYQLPLEGKTFGFIMKYLKEQVHAKRISNH